MTKQSVSKPKAPLVDARLLTAIVRDAVATAFVDERARPATAPCIPFGVRPAWERHGIYGELKARVPALPGTRIVNYTQDELTAAIESACNEFGHAQFFKMLNGIDAYMERRKRRYGVARHD